MIRPRDAELIEKILEARAERPAPFVAAVKSRCICRNMGEPDANGFIAYSPSCGFHGVHSRAPKYDMQIDLEAI